MRINTSVFWTFFAILALLGAIIVSTGLASASNRRVTEAEQHRFESRKLADQLRQSSDDLTRMARTYVVTGDPAFEEYFHEVQAIRDGAAPRPRNYAGIYWDIVTATGDRPAHAETRVALIDLLKQVGLSDAELAKLREAKNNSDDLIKLEETAFAAMKGVFPDAAGNLTVKGDPNQPLARELLHGEQYHSAKAAIMRPIGEFLTLLDQKTLREVAAFREQERRYRDIVRALIVCTILCSVIAFFQIKRRVINPILALSRIAGRIEAGEIDERAAVSSTDEIGALNNAFNNMVGQTQAAMENLKQEIAQRKRATDELRSSQQLFRAMTETALDAIITADHAGNITSINAGARRLFGYGETEVLGQPLEMLMPERYREEHTGGIQRYVSTSEPRIIGRTVEVAALRRDGSEVPVELSLSTWTTPQRETAFTGIMRDIAERKEAERQLNLRAEEIRRSQADLRMAKEAAEHANRAKSDFLANMSHEIRTPMNGIIGMTELLMDTGLSAQQRDYVSMVDQSADALLHLINDILDFSKIEAGKLELAHVDFSLRDALGNTLRTLAVRAGAIGLELAGHIPPDVPDGLVGDPGRLRQVIMNLVGNAIKFTEHGEVVLDVAVESLTDERASLRFSVRDTGPGISAERRQLIFKAFNQGGDTSLTRQYGGTGLGLTISAQLVEMMGGRLELESRLGQGSTFYFTVPLELSTAAPAKPPAEPIDLHRLQVLIVDNNETNLQILDEMLRSWQMLPTPADSGPSALNELERAAEKGAPFQLVLLDTIMPTMDGFALAEQIRKRPDLGEPALIVLSSAGQEEGMRRGKKLGVVRCLIKPVKQSELLDAITGELGIAVETGAGAPEPPQARPGIDRRLHVLVAEDGVINQKVALHLLKRRGHSATIAADGRKALSALEAGKFDLILMDVEMPIMDGFEATAAIREREIRTGAHIPIVAMTAHALRGDRERCLAAGMDGYLTKPIRAKELYDAVEGAVETGADTRADNSHSEASHAKQVLDWDESLRQVGGSEEILIDAAELLLVECPRMVEQIRDAIADGDAPLLRRAAHTLKGSAKVFAAKPTAGAASRLETMGRDGEFAEAGQALTELEREVERLLSALSEQIQGGGTG